MRSQSETRRFEPTSSPSVMITTTLLHGVPELRSCSA